MMYRLVLGQTFLIALSFFPVNFVRKIIHIHNNLSTIDTAPSKLLMASLNKYYLENVRRGHYCGSFTMSFPLENKFVSNYPNIYGFLRHNTLLQILATDLQFIIMDTWT